MVDQSSEMQLSHLEVGSTSFSTLTQLVRNGVLNADIMYVKQKTTKPLGFHVVHDYRLSSRKDIRLISKLHQLVL